MAGLRNPHKASRGSSKPNTALIAFLVFFILLSIGLGVWLYTEFGDRDKTKADAVHEAKIATEAVKHERDLERLKRIETQVAQGFKDKLTKSDLTFYEETRGIVLQAGSPYEKEAGMAEFKDLIKRYSADLGGYNDKDKKYEDTYPAKFAREEIEKKQAQASLKKEQDGKKAAEDQFRKLQTAYKATWEKLKTEIRDYGAAALKQATKINTQMDAQIAANDAHLNKYKDDMAKMEKVRIELQAELRLAQQQLQDAKKQLALAQGQAGRPNAQANVKTPHALMLDVSKGRTLWDDAVGKITKVDIKNRTVFVNVGSNLGVQPGTTFNVFGAGTKLTAIGPLKATIEITRVLNGATSQARMTSLFGADGLEISLYGTGKSRLIREREKPVQEGDLLFNLALGTHVAIAGNIYWKGQRAQAPEEQMEIIDRFRRMLKRQGITVDAYVDLRDGSLHGKITSQTKFLIRGDNIYSDPFAKADDKSHEKINAGIKAAMDEAISKGMFIISSDNFAFVTGFRPPQSGDETTSAGFRATNPSSGVFQITDGAGRKNGN